MLAVEKPRSLSISLAAISEQKPTQALQPKNKWLEFLEKIGEICSYGMSVRHQNTGDLRSPVSCSSCLTTEPPSPTASVEQSFPDIHRLMNEGKSTQSIIELALKDQHFSTEDAKILTEKLLTAYNQQKKSIPLKTMPGAAEFLQHLQKYGVDFCFCTNASAEKTAAQLQRTFNQSFKIYGKCHKGDLYLSQTIAKMLKAQYSEKKLIVIGNEVKDAGLSLVLQQLGADAQCILVGKNEKLPETKSDIRELNPCFSFNTYDYQQGFTAAKTLIEHYGAENCAIILDVHGTALDIADLLKNVIEDKLNEYHHANF